MFQVKEAVNDDTVIVDADKISPDFENNDDEVDVEATPVDANNEDVQTLPGQACYLKSEY